MVFSYIGTHNPQFSGMVIRLRKAPRKDTTHEDDARDGRIEDDAEYDAEEDDPSIAFQSKVISLLVPPKYLPFLESCRVNQAWLTRLAALAEPSRLVDRTLKDTIDTNKRRAVLATDLVGGAGWAVEIKPKWAFLPNPKYLSPETRKVKTSHSRFVMHTHYRAVKGDATPITSYDPLDLFSEDQDRITIAIEALWDAWIASGGTLNNLKIFVEGRLITPSEALSTSKGLAFYLDPASRGEQQGSSLAALKQSFTRALLPLITQTELIRSIRTLQSTLDSFDIEGLAALWAQVHGTEIPLGSGEPEPTLGEWVAFVNTYHTQGLKINEQSPTNDQLRYHILAYLLSATFKDCSVILRYPALSSEEGGKPSVTVIDLDQKPVKSLAKWAQLDRDIAETYAARHA